MKSKYLIIMSVLCIMALLANCKSQTTMAPTPASWSTVQTADELQTQLAEHQFVVVDFSAEWCGYCRKLKPILIKLSEKYAGKIHFIDVDVDAAGALAKQYSVGGIPDVRFFRDGRPAGGFKGYRDESDVQSLLEALME